MGKVNLVQALDQAREENLNPHPYWGLECNRGLWLTRFPKKIMPENPAFMMAFIKAGGNLDAMGHWGETPDSIRQKEEAGWSLHEIALFGKGVPADLCGVVGLDETNWRVYKRGLDRAEVFKINKIEFSCSIWTLGRKPLVSFLKKLFSKGFKVTSKGWGYFKNTDVVINNYVCYRRECTATNRSGDEYKIKEALIVEGIVTYEMGWIHPRLLEFCRHFDVPTRKEKNMNYNSPNRRVVSNLFSSLQAAKIFFSLIKSKFSVGNKSFTPQWTSVGRIAQIHADLLVCVREDGTKKLHSVRSVTVYSVCKIADTWFVWQGEFGYSHFEGKGSLKSVIELAERRRKKDSLILTLNDVRNDRKGTAGFCFAGTKSFLQNRMPHVYRLVANYSSWAEVPEEIATIEWHLDSKSIFKGYSSPVSY